MLGPPNRLRPTPFAAALFLAVAAILPASESPDGTENAAPSAPVAPYEPADDFHRASFRGDAAIAGRLTWSDGSPAAGVALDLVGYTQGQPPRAVREATTDADGRYVFEGVRGKTARYRIFLKDDPLQRTFYIFVPKPDSRVSHDYSFQPRVGDPAPPHVMPDPDGRPVDLADFRGKVVVVKFWAVWCGPCHAGTIRLGEIVRRRADWKDRVVVLAVNADARRADFERFVREHELEGMVHLFEEGKKLESVRDRGFRVDSLPFVFVLDEAGVVRARAEDLEDPEAVVDALLKD